jgi:DNA-binding SARP family transcriptional activator
MLLSKTGVPRLTPLTIHRTRLERWLQAYSQTPVRLVVAPSGCGKSTTLLTYAAERDTDVAYCALPPECDPARLRQALAGALALPKVPKTYAQLVEAISGNPARCVEIAVDEIDNGTPDTMDELLRLVEDVTENITFIYAGRSRERIQARRLIARGLAELCDARRLAFDEEEGALFAQACGAACTELEIRRLLDDTDGWAVALCGTIRTAAAEGETLQRAYERWRKQSSAFLHELLESELERVSDGDRSLFWSVMSGRSSGEVTQLRHLEACGLFIYEDGDRLRPYRAIQPPAAKAVSESPASPMEIPATPPLMVHMFQSFDAKVGGREIPWVRRRDQQIVKYLLLKPDGKASRAELASVFWSDTDRHLATQSVRTACSTIRKAFAMIVGYSAVDAYFRTAPDVQIDLSHVVCDVRRFTAHIVDAESCFSRGDQEGAAMHYRAAEKLYAGGLLDFEATEPWFATHARLLRDRYVMLLERLGEIAFERNDLTSAQEYAQRARSLEPEQPGILQLVARVRSAQQARMETVRVSRRALPEELPPLQVVS